MADPLLEWLRAARILVIVAHPDDETVGFGASLFRLATAQVRARIVVATDGAPRDPSLRARCFNGSRDDYARARRVELARALAEVGLNDRDVIELGLVDQEAAHHLVWLARTVAELTERERPDVIVTHPYEGGHPDHDAVAFAVHAGVRTIRGATTRVVEMTSYHASDDALVTGAFLGERAIDGACDVPMDARTREVKRRMFSAYATQRDVLAAFCPDRERLRVAPAYDFGASPHDGPLHYERLGWALSGARFRELARDASAALSFEPRRPRRHARPPSARARGGLRVLSVSYGLGEVSADSQGGAEQVLATLDAALVAAGHESVVVAPLGSRVEGELVATPPIASRVDAEVRRRAARAHAEAIREVLEDGRPIDLIHFHGLDFLDYLPEDGPPALVTLHLPASYYRARAFGLTRAQTWLNPVSSAQAATCPPSLRLLPPIANGVAVERLSRGAPVRDEVVMIARLCPEKGVHVAIDAAARAGIPLTIAGPVQPYPEHERYFDEVIAPKLGARCRWMGPVGGASKRALLAGARALVVASSVPETSSLVAMEAIASGTPVAALRVGALAEVVEEGVTGALADDPAGLATAITRASRLDRDACARRGRARFEARTMTDRYLLLYQRLAGLSGVSLGSRRAAGSRLRVGA